MAEMAVRHHSIGLTNEEVVEVRHAIFNRRKHLYWSLKNEEARLAALVKDLQRQSDAVNPRRVDPSRWTRGKRKSKAKGTAGLCLQPDGLLSIEEEACKETAAIEEPHGTQSDGAVVGEVLETSLES